MYKLAFIGFGTVARGLAEILIEKEEVLNKNYGFSFSVIAISDPLYGMIHNPSGISLKDALSLVKDGKRIDDLGETGWDSLRVVRESDADIVLEATPTNLETGEPGVTHIKEALKSGKHVVTTNKGPIALFYRELMGIAKEREVLLRFEGTVLSGTPTLNLSNCLGGVDFLEIRGIVNGTTNFILTEMEKGKTYEEALREAQRLGYAEAKPDADVEGFDALAKILILSNVILGAELKPKDVERRGITGLTPEDIERAMEEGKRWKLIAKAKRDGGRVVASVMPETVGKEDFLYHISGVTNAVQFKTDILQDIIIVGPGAGGREAGYALLTDMLDIHRTLKRGI
jgi:homoserine dehydrogenase